MSRSPHQSSRPPGSAGYELFAIVAGLRECAGVYGDVNAAKRRSRIDYRAGRVCQWIAIDRTLGRIVAEWEVVGNPERAHGPDCVMLWPKDPADGERPTAPAAQVNTLPAVVNRVAWALKRLGRGRAA